MIISHKYKFLFIGLPFSASSAISKELHLKYEGKSILRKHSLYYEFEKVANKSEMNYFTFSVLRNPMDIAITVYEKMRANSKGNFTNPEFFSENGGHITIKHRKMFNFIHKNKATFQQYFIRFFNTPYDSLASITIDNCNYVIRYEKIQTDYINALKKAGIPNPRPLPVANKTVGKRKEVLEYYTDDIREKAIFVFGPFLEKYNYSFPESWGSTRVSALSTIQFKLLAILRKIYHKYVKKHPRKLASKGTIYGDMQRNNLSGS